MKKCLIFVAMLTLGPAPAAVEAVDEIPFVLEIIDKRPPLSPWFKMAGDLNGNGRLDIVLTPAELAGQTYKIAWYEAPADPRAQWTEHVVVDKIEAVVHALALGDFNRNGRVDIAYAEMHQGVDPDEVVIMLNRGAGEAWRKQVLSTRGSHDLLAVDIDGDGNLDLIGANHGGPYHALELYRIGGER